MNKKITLLFPLILFTLVTIHGQTLFDWENAVDLGNDVTQTIDGITVTTDFIDADIYDVGPALGSSGNSVLSLITQNTVSFSFSEPVMLNSILTFGGFFMEIEYTYTSTGGSNSPVVITMIGRTANVVLNWTDVTSFTLTSPVNNRFAFDNLLINDTSLAIDDQTLQKPRVYPSPVEDILYVKNVTDLKNLLVFNILGQKVLETKELEIDFSKIPAGIYTLQINTDTGIENKKIIKK